MVTSKLFNEIRQRKVIVLFQNFKPTILSIKKLNRTDNNKIKVAIMLKMAKNLILRVMYTR